MQTANCSHRLNYCGKPVTQRIAFRCTEQLLSLLSTCCLLNERTTLPSIRCRVISGGDKNHDRSCSQSLQFTDSPKLPDDNDVHRGRHRCLVTDQFERRAC